MDYKVHNVQWTDEKVRRFWDFINTYAHFDHLWFSKSAGRGIIGFVKTFFPIQGRVLDYGVGKGYFTGYLLENRRVESVACDFSEETVANVNGRFKGQERFKGCFLVQGMPTPFKANEFDVVFLIEAIEHLTDDYLSATLKEIQRILKSGGTFVVTTPNEEILEQQNVSCPDCGGVFHRMQHIRSFSRATLEPLVKSFGFKTLFCGATDFAEHGEKGLLYRVKNTIVKTLKKSYLAPHLVYLGEKA